MPRRAVCESPIHRIGVDRAIFANDVLAVEEPLEIRLVYGPAQARQTKSVSITMRTPDQDFELAAGFLMTEGVVSDPEDIVSIHFADGPMQSSGPNTVCVELAPEVDPKMASLERNFYTTSSCGVCGKASLLALQAVCPPRHANHFSIHFETLSSMAGELRGHQSLFQLTGGLHADGLFDSDGVLHTVCEDVGRHNAVDKLIGAEFLADRIPLRDRVILLSGRASFELLQKAVMAGIPMVASIGAPCSLAVRVAREFDVTLVGLLRDDTCSIYHGSERVLVPQ